MDNKTIENKVDCLLIEAFIQDDITDVPDIEQNPELKVTLGNIGSIGESAFLDVDMRGSLTLTEQHRLQTITKRDMWVKETYKFKNSNIEIYKTGYYRSL